MTWLLGKLAEWGFKTLQWFTRNVLFNPKVWMVVGIVLAAWISFMAILSHGESIQAKEDGKAQTALTEHYNAEIARVTKAWNTRITAAQNALTQEQQHEAEITAKYQVANQKAQDLFDENTRLRNNQYAVAMQLSALSPDRPANYPVGGLSDTGHGSTTTAPVSSMFCSGAFLFKQDKQLLSGFANDADAVVADDLHVRSMYANLSASVTATNQSIHDACAASIATSDPLTSKACGAIVAVPVLDTPAAIDAPVLK